MTKFSAGQLWKVNNDLPDMDAAGDFEFFLVTEARADKQIFPRPGAPARLQADSGDENYRFHRGIDENGIEHTMNEGWLVRRYNLFVDTE